MEVEPIRLTSTVTAPGKVGAQRRIVVGFDASERATSALRWASYEAARRGARLTIMNVWDPYPAVEWSSAVAEWRTRAREQLETAMATAERLTRGNVEIDAHATKGVPVRELLQEGAAAVLGSAGHVGLLGAVTGSTSRHCAREATSPVVLVGPEVVPGDVQRYVTSATLDTSGAAGQWLGAELARRPLPVTVVDSWDVDASTPGPMYGVVTSEVEQSASTEHDAAVTKMRAMLPADSQVSVDFRRGHPAEGLRSASHVGDLVVISRSALHDVEFTHEECPVIVIPDN
jgi:nucleotide-binding universal stress UspA family protein